MEIKIIEPRSLTDPAMSRGSTCRLHCAVDLSTPSHVEQSNVVTCPIAKAKVGDEQPTDRRTDRVGSHEGGLVGFLGAFLEKKAEPSCSDQTNNGSVRFISAVRPPVDESSSSAATVNVSGSSFVTAFQ